jgi:Uma2 family endonuclease
MATTTTPVTPQGRLFTAADLAALPTRLPSGDVDYELDKGRLVIMVPPGHMHGSTQSRIATEITLQGERKGHGRAFTEVGIVLSRNPDSVVGADAAFIVTANLPVRESREGYLETIPDLIVEIRSKNDTHAELETKADGYLAAGARVVWIVDPLKKSVIEHRPKTLPRTLHEFDVLTNDDVIPDFRLNVAELFRP